jgi:hypothetical protein
LTSLSDAGDAGDSQGTELNIDDLVRDMSGTIAALQAELAAGLGDSLDESNVRAG